MQQPPPESHPTASRTAFAAPVVPPRILCDMMQIGILNSCSAVNNSDQGNQIPVPQALPGGYHRCLWHSDPSGEYSQSTSIYKYIGVTDMNGREVPWRTGMPFIQGIHVVVYQPTIITYALYQGACPPKPEDTIKKSETEAKAARAAPVNVEEKKEEVTNREETEVESTPPQPPSPAHSGYVYGATYVTGYCCYSSYYHHYRHSGMRWHPLRFHLSARRYWHH